MAMLAGALPAQAKPPAPKPDYRTPPRNYRDVVVDGRTFRVEEQLLGEKPALARLALARLKKNIDLALRILPAHSHKHVAKQRFYVMYGPEARGGGRDNGLEYFRPGSPKYDARRDKDWNSVVVVYCAKNYTQLTDLWALKAVMHELAHAYQLEQWPEKQPDILAAYKKAMAGKLYRRVKHNEGGTVKDGYATANQLEYFAELSCMFFAKCNYPPHDWRALRKVDPAGYAMLRKMWRIGGTHGTHEPRPWRLEQRSELVLATFVSLKDGRVTVRDKRGKTRTVSLDSLDHIDRAYVERWQDDDERTAIHDTEHTGMSRNERGTSPAAR